MSQEAASQVSSAARGLKPTTIPGLFGDFPRNCS